MGNRNGKALKAKYTLPSNCLPRRRSSGKLKKKSAAAQTEPIATLEGTVGELQSVTEHTM